MLESATLERGRAAYSACAWAQAHASLCEADRTEPLGPDDLEMLARSAYLLGRDSDYVAALERAYQAHLASGAGPRAARCAFWIGHNRLFRGDVAQAMGWFGRARRVVDALAEDCVERGYLLVPTWLQQMAAGDFTSAHAATGVAAEIAERFADRDLLLLARDEQGRALIGLGRVDEGLRLVDEALVAAGAGELSPIVTGIVYCNTIAFCQDAFELRHAREWTQALAEWCDSQPDMVEHNGLCRVHRAEILQVQGAWDEALAEASTAVTRFTAGVLNGIAAGKAHYRMGEIHRLRGGHSDAEAAYREASRAGYEPQPGLALLRLAQGKVDVADAAIRRVADERTRPLERGAVLPAYVEIALACGEPDRALAASREMEDIATAHGNEWLAAGAALARGQAVLAADGAGPALGELRRAWRLWATLGAPYEAGRVRVLLGQALRAMGDEDSARLEFDAARTEFERLGARPEVARVAALVSASGGPGHSLTVRELEVLRLVKAGEGNRAIAAQLTISEHTVARHLQNIFRKLGVTTRTAATAYAFEHDLG